MVRRLAILATLACIGNGSRMTRKDLDLGELGINATLFDPSDAEDNQVVDGEEKPEKKTVSAKVLGADVRSCLCRISMWSYQQWPRAQDGAGCIGGCGGGEFQINPRFGATLKSLTVWTANSSSNSHIRAIRFTFDDNQRFVVGNAVGGGGPWTFTFQPGETVRGDLRLSGNGRGQVLGSIGFQTSAGRSFAVGMTSPNRYLFPTGNAYMAGFMGAAGSDVDRLGVIFWKPIRSIAYDSLTYPTLHTLSRIRSPDSVATRTYCNSAPFTLPFIQETQRRLVRTGSETCVETSASAQFSTSITVRGGIPAVTQVESEARWEVSASTSFKNCETRLEEHERTLDFPALNMPARSRIDFVFSQWSGRLRDLPFRAVLRITLNDGTNFSRAETGTYTGVSFTDTVQAWNNFEENITRC